MTRVVPVRVAPRWQGIGGIGERILVPGHLRRDGGQGGIDHGAELAEPERGARRRGPAGSRPRPGRRRRSTRRGRDAVARPGRRTGRRCRRPGRASARRGRGWRTGGNGPGDRARGTILRRARRGRSQKTRGSDAGSPRPREKLAWMRTSHARCLAAGGQDDGGAPAPPSEAGGELQGVVEHRARGAVDVGRANDDVGAVDHRAARARGSPTTPVPGLGMT